MRFVLLMAISLSSVSAVHAQSSAELEEHPPGFQPEVNEPSEWPKISFSVSLGASFGGGSIGGFPLDSEDIQTTGAVLGGALHVAPFPYLRFNVRTLFSYVGIIGDAETSDGLDFSFTSIESEAFHAGLLAQLDVMIGHFSFGPLVRLDLLADVTREIEDLFILGGLSLGVQAEGVEINVIGTYGVSQRGMAGGQIDLLLSFHI